MSFGQDFLRGFIGADGLKDYFHAAKTFRTNGYEFAPRNKFLYHVFFTLNTQIPSVKSAFGDDVSTIGLLVKTIQLPTYKVSTDVMNQYNRKRIVQTKIEYEPISVVFHDDGGDLTRNLWYNYFSYYYKDPSQKYGTVPNTNGTLGNLQGNFQGFDYNARDIYNSNLAANDWGYVGESYSDGAGPAGSQVSSSAKLPFFRDVRIYGLCQHKFAEYVLINPIIETWNHDEYNYSQNDGIMENRMTLRFETVKYYSGAIGGVRPDTNVQGFADPVRYDTIRSAIARPGSTASVLGKGGLIDTGVGIIEDLQSGSVAGLIGAVQKAGTTYDTFKDKNIRSVVNQDARLAQQVVLRGTLPGAVRAAVGAPPSPAATSPTFRSTLDGAMFPTPPRSGPTRNYQSGR